MAENDTGAPGIFELAFRRDVASRAFGVALVVGTLLAAINHGAAIVSGEMTATRWVMVVATYAVPYAVSAYSSVGALRRLDVLCTEHDAPKASGAMNAVQAASAVAMIERDRD